MYLFAAKKLEFVYCEHFISERAVTLNQTRSPEKKK